MVFLTRTLLTQAVLLWKNAKLIAEGANGAVGSNVQIDKCTDIKAGSSNANAALVGSLAAEPYAEFSNAASATADVEGTFGAAFHGQTVTVTLTNRTWKTDVLPNGTAVTTWFIAADSEDKPLIPTCNSDFKAVVSDVASQTVTLSLSGTPTTTGNGRFYLEIPAGSFNETDMQQLNIYPSEAAKWDIAKGMPTATIDNGASGNAKEIIGSVDAEIDDSFTIKLDNATWNPKGTGIGEYEYTGIQDWFMSNELMPVKNCPAGVTFSAEVDTDPTQLVVTVSGASEVEISSVISRVHIPQNAITVTDDNNYEVTTSITAGGTVTWKIGSKPAAAAVATIISGKKGVELVGPNFQTIVITLANAKFADADNISIEDKFAISPYPIGITITYTVSEGGSKATISFGGTPTATCSDAFEIRVLQGAIVPSGSGYADVDTGLAVTTAGTLKWNITAPGVVAKATDVKGFVGFAYGGYIDVELNDLAFKNTVTGTSIAANKVETYFTVTNLPAGVSIKNADINADSAKIYLSGSPEAIGNGAISVKVMQAALEDADKDYDAILKLGGNLTWEIKEATISISDIKVKGKKGTSINSNNYTATLTVNNGVTWSDAYAEEPLDVTSWFTNCPNGITVKAIRINDSFCNQLILTFSGKPTTTKNEEMTITIPAGDKALFGRQQANGEYQAVVDDFTVEANPNAKWSISAPSGGGGGGSVTPTYTFTFNYDSMGGSFVAPQSVEKNTDTPRPYGELGVEMPTPTRDGYDFVGWFFSNGVQLTNDTTVNTYGHNLYAKWAEKGTTATTTITSTTTTITTTKYNGGGSSGTVVAPVTNLKNDSGNGISWTASPDAVQYYIYKNGAKATLTFNSYYCFQALKAGTTYEIAVTAVNANGLESEKATVKFIASTMLARPTNVSRIGNTLCWDAVPGAASYKVYVIDMQNNQKYLATRTGVTDTSYSFKSLKNGKTYKLRVCAVDKNGKLGKWSVII